MYSIWFGRGGRRELIRHGQIYGYGAIYTTYVCDVRFLYFTRQPGRMFVHILVFISSCLKKQKQQGDFSRLFAVSAKVNLCVMNLWFCCAIYSYIKKLHGVKIRH